MLGKRTHTFDTALASALLLPVRDRPCRSRKGPANMPIRLFIFSLLMLMPFAAGCDAPDDAPSKPVPNGPTHPLPAPQAS